MGSTTAAAEIGRDRGLGNGLTLFACHSILANNASEVLDRRARGYLSLNGAICDGCSGIASNSTANPHYEHTSG